MSDWPHPDSILWDLPGGPIHPVDVMLAEMHRENRMREIREMDIDEWVLETVKAAEQQSCIPQQLSYRRR